MFRLFEMASLSTKKTGLPLKIYVSAKGNSKHGARIKISSLYGDKIKFDELFSVTISDDPKIIGKHFNIKSEDISKVIEFVLDNKEALLLYWNEKIDTDELIDLLIFEK